MKSGKLYKILSVTSAILSVFVSCNEDPANSVSKFVPVTVDFSGKVADIDALRTRTIDSTYIAYEPFSMPFFIQMCTTDENGNEVKTVSTYAVTSGYEGRLDAMYADKALEWKTLNQDHVFYAWNTEYWEKTEGTGVSTGEGTEPDDNGQEEISGSADPVEIVFHNSPEGVDGYDKYTNNSIYENFIGAKSESYKYSERGKYVELKFYHLVSKIKIGSFILIEPGGAIQKDLQAEMTFIGIPTAATFYPHPQDDGHPVVKVEQEVDPDDGLTFFIGNKATVNDVFYICPEVNFSEIDYKITLNATNYQYRGTYYGTFQNVEFVRNHGTDYDGVNDQTTLHAGEMMTLNITLIPGIGPGLKLIIDNWSTESYNESRYQPYPGLYTASELMELIDYFASQKIYFPSENGWEAVEAQLQRFLELYGKTIDDQKWFLIYDNITIDSNIFPIPYGFMLNGYGHTVFMKTNSSGGIHNGHPYYNIGPARDIYLSDPNGNNTIYIDAEGFIWVTDETTGELIKTENQLTDLVGNEKSYDIDSKTGAIRKSNYYNNNITG